MLRMLLGAAAIAAVLSTDAAAQDVPGLENCMAEKAMDRRTGCLQSNVNYLYQLIGKSAADAQQRLGAAAAEIAALRATVAALQTRLDQIEAAQKAAADAAKKAEPAKADAAKPK